MIHNSRGVTLVEMLAVIVVATICFTLIFSIWLSGEKSAQHTLTQNDLQADAHLVQARITQAFYNQIDKPFSLALNNGQVELTYDSDSSNPEVISDPNLFYNINGSGDSTSKPVKNGSSLEVDFDIAIRTSSGASSDGPNFHLNTTLNYPWDEGSSAND